MYIKNDPFASYKLLKTEFIKKGYTVNEDVADERLFVTYTSPSGVSWQTSAALLKYPCIADSVREISRHKEQAYRYAEQRGVSIPFTYTLNVGDSIALLDASKLFHKYQNLIVKPSNASLSRGLTVDVTSYEMLIGAIDVARAVCPTVLIQEQVEGEEVRFTVIDGKVEAALLRQTPRVIGDGFSTVEALIHAENDVRKTLVFPYLAYPELNELIIPPELFTSKRVLAAGEVLQLNRATMVKNGCSIYDVVKQVHSSYVTMVETLVRDLDARFVVVDMFLKDYRMPQKNHNHWFIEFNTSPVLKLYYACRDGQMFDIAPRLANSIDKGLQQQKA